MLLFDKQLYAFVQTCRKNKMKEQLVDDFIYLNKKKCWKSKRQYSESVWKLINNNIEHTYIYIIIISE